MKIYTCEKNCRMTHRSGQRIILILVLDCFKISQKADNYCIKRGGGAQ